MLTQMISEKNKDTAYSSKQCKKIQQISIEETNQRLEDINVIKKKPHKFLIIYFVHDILVVMTTVIIAVSPPEKTMDIICLRQMAESDLNEEHLCVTFFNSTLQKIDLITSTEIKSEELN